MASMKNLHASTWKKWFLVILFQRSVKLEANRLEHSSGQWTCLQLYKIPIDQYPHLNVLEQNRIHCIWGVHAYPDVDGEAAAIVGDHVVGGVLAGDEGVWVPGVVTRLPFQDLLVKRCLLLLQYTERQWYKWHNTNSNLDISNSDISNSAKLETSIWIKNTFLLLSPAII